MMIANQWKDFWNQSSGDYQNSPWASIRWPSQNTTPKQSGLEDWQWTGGTPGWGAGGYWPGGTQEDGYGSGRKPGFENSSKPWSPSIIDDLSPESPHFNLDKWTERFGPNGYIRPGQQLPPGFMDQIRPESASIRQRMNNDRTHADTRYGPATHPNSGGGYWSGGRPGAGQWLEASSQVAAPANEVAAATSPMVRGVASSQHNLTQGPNSKFTASGLPVPANTPARAPEAFADQPAFASAPQPYDTSFMSGWAGSPRPRNFFHNELMY